MLHGSPFVVPSLVSFCCCCCLPGGVPFTGGVAGPGGLPPDDTEDLVEFAVVFSRDTGRACGDFFRTLRSGGSFADFVLSRRATLLDKVLDLDDFAFLATQDTVCALVDAPRLPPVEFRREPLRPLIEFFAFGTERATFIASIPLGGPFGTRGEAVAAGVARGFRVPGPGEVRRPGLIRIVERPVSQ